jgi:hypothetical protein
MASMLVRLQERSRPMATTASPFTDIAGSPHAEAIDKVFTAGITSGTSATTFTPNAGVRRDGMSVFLVRSFGGLAEAGGRHVAPTHDRRRRPAGAQLLPAAWRSCVGTPAPPAGA